MSQNNARSINDLMKICVIVAFSFVVVVVASAAATPDDACAECKANVTKLAAFLASDETVNVTIKSFNRDLCPYSGKDTVACQKNVTALWPSMARALFTEQSIPEVACLAMKKCSSSLRDAPCDSCKAFINDVGTYMQSKDAIKAAFDFFSGADFCASAKPPIPKSDCIDFASWFTPSAWQVLGQVLSLADQPLCNIVFNECK